MKKLFSLLLTLCLILCLCPAALAGEASAQVIDIQKYGNLVLSLKGTELLNEGFAYGDIVTVTIAGQEVEMPVGSNYSDVENGGMICRVVVKENEDYIVLAINMGDLATTLGIAEKEKTDTDPGFLWHYKTEEPVQVSFAMKEKGGYYGQWVIHQLVRTEVRENYAHLTDEAYANFRLIATVGMGQNRLYRSSSPVNPEINRNKEADAAAKAAGVKTIINLADNEETMKAYEGFGESYYAGQNVICLNLGVDFSASEFREGVADGMRFIAANDGPYLVHCNEGKDRAGFFSAVLEALMGASEEEITADYMVTFYNYYGVEPGTEQYAVIARTNIQKSLANAFGLDSLEGNDLKAAAEKYLAQIGLTPDEIAAVQKNLAE